MSRCLSNVLIIDSTSNVVLNVGIKKLKVVSGSGELFVADTIYPTAQNVEIEFPNVNGYPCTLRVGSTEGASRRIIILEADPHRNINYGKDCANYIWAYTGIAKADSGSSSGSFGGDSSTWSPGSGSNSGEESDGDA